MADNNQSLAGALNLKPEAMQFISGGNDQAKKEKTPRRQQVENKQLRTAKSKVGDKQPYKLKLRREKVAPELPPSVQLSQPRVAITIRLTPATAETLRRASLERKLQGEFPHSQQEIIEHAVRDWLTANK